MKIWLDMDGTIADLYAVPNWLPMLRASNPTPYATAKPMVNMATLARLLNNRQREGFEICIISALSKDSTPEYDEAVKAAKLEWLNKHLPSVKFDEIRFVPYSYPKTLANTGLDFLFDDEARHLDKWTGIAIHASELLTSLKSNNLFHLLEQVLYPALRH